MSETQLVKTIMDALKHSGYWAIRINSGATVIPGTLTNARRVIKGAPAGTPDILVMKRVLRHREAGHLFDGTEPVAMVIGLEVKTAKGKQLPSQKAWQEQAAKNGVPYAVVRSAHEALEFVKSV
jgi:hypothetical protein